MTVRVEKQIHVHVLEIPGLGGFVTTKNDGNPHDHSISPEAVADMRTRAMAAGMSAIADALRGVDGPIVLTESDNLIAHAHRARIGDQEYTTRGPETVTPSLHVMKLPRVLTKSAVRDGFMPPPGESGIPKSLEQDVPGEYRYWLVDDQDVAIRVRRALVESGVMESGELHIVDGEPRRVVKDADGKMVLPVVSTEVPRDPGVRTPLQAAVEKVGHGSGGILMSAAASSLVSPERLLSSVLDMGDHAVVEFDRGGEFEKAISNEGLLPCCFEVVDSGDVAFFSTSWPESVEFLADVPGDILSLYARRRTIGDDEEVFVDGPPDGPLSALSSSLARSPTERQALLAYCLIDRELRRPNPREDRLLALGYDSSVVVKREFVPISKRVEEDKRLVTGIVASPNTADLVGDVIGAADHEQSAEQIRRLAYDFLEFHRTTGLQHQFEIDGRAAIVESFVTRCEQEIGGRVVLEGTWIITMRVRDDAIWGAIKSGEITGFSLGGFGRREIL